MKREKVKIKRNQKRKLRREENWFRKGCRIYQKLVDTGSPGGYVLRIHEELKNKKCTAVKCETEKK